MGSLIQWRALFTRSIVVCGFLASFGGIQGCARRAPPPPQAPVFEESRPSLWILVDTKADRLTVFRRNDVELVINNIAWGSAGAGIKTRRGDNITPRGVYMVGNARHSKRFDRFISINYPEIADAQRGFEQHLISQHTLNKIIEAHQLGIMPPQDTALGGQLGIHGVGKGNLEIHRIANWTNGCIAVENAQIRQIAKLVRPGTIVEIR